MHTYPHIFVYIATFLPTTYLPVLNLEIFWVSEMITDEPHPFSNVASSNTLFTTDVKRKALNFKTKLSNQFFHSA